MGKWFNFCGGFDKEIEDKDAIDEELNKIDWDRYNSEDHLNESYGVHQIGRASCRERV